MEEYAHLHEELNDLNPDSMPHEAKKMLLGLGFKEEDFDKPVAIKYWLAYAYCACQIIAAKSRFLSF